MGDQGKGSGVQRQRKKGWEMGGQDGIVGDKECYLTLLLKAIQRHCVEEQFKTKYNLVANFKTFWR